VLVGWRRTHRGGKVLPRGAGRPQARDRHTCGLRLGHDLRAKECCHGETSQQTAPQPCPPVLRKPVSAGTSSHLRRAP
jgi:hypothetical protein